MKVSWLCITKAPVQTKNLPERDGGQNAHLHTKIEGVALWVGRHEVSAYNYYFFFQAMNQCSPEPMNQGSPERYYKLSLRWTRHNVPTTSAVEVGFLDHS